jgi:hypothetical protein
VERNPAAIEIDSPEAPTPEALVHPLLTPAISILARWRGDLALHAGGFFHSGRGWALLGGKGSGKSTTLAQLAVRGAPVLGDDLLLVDARRSVLAGPACVDLRMDVSDRFPDAERLGHVGDRERARLSTTPAPSAAGLSGIFLLDWSEAGSADAERLAPGDALRLLYQHEYLGLLGPSPPERILDLVELPVWRVTRPREWERSQRALDLIEEVAAGA